MTNRMRLSTDGGCALCFGIGVCNGSEGPMVCPACGGDGHDRPTCRSCAGTGRNVADVPTGAIARFFGEAETKRRLVTCPTCKGSGKGWPRPKAMPPRPPPLPGPRPARAVAGTSLVCTECGCRWKKHPPDDVFSNGSLQLYDADQRPCAECCDNTFHPPLRHETPDDAKGDSA